MKRYEDLTIEEQQKAIQFAVITVLRDIVESGIRFNDKLNKNDLQARIDKAFAKAEAMRTPWFAGEYVMETCGEDIKSLAVPIAEESLYSENETVFSLSEVLQ